MKHHFYSLAVALFFSLDVMGGQRVDLELVASHEELPNSYSVKAYKRIETNDPVHKTLWVDNATDNFYWSDDLASEMRFAFSFDSSIQNKPSGSYSCFVLPNDDVLFVYRTEFHGSEPTPTDGIRRNPILYAAGNGYKPLEIDFGDGLKPSGWLQDVGAAYSAKDNALFIAEYTRGNVPAARCWRVSMPVSDPTNWHIVLEKDIVFPYGKGFKHFHTAQVDPYTGVVYLSSGDDNTSAGLWCSVDGGSSFSQIDGYNRKKWRMLNMSFTDDCIYWASDDWGNNHALWKAQRDASGILDPNSLSELVNFSTADKESLVKGSARLATYATVYLKKYNALLFLDRDDEGNHTSIDIRIYDIESEECYVAATVHPLVSNATWGFRCESVTTYPEGDDIVISFGYNYPNRTDGAGNFSSSLLKRINTLVLHVTKTQAGYNVELRKFSPQSLVTHIPTAIDNNVPTIVSVFDVNGRLLNRPSQGINILQMSDGTYRKVLY